MNVDPTTKALLHFRRGAGGVGPDRIRLLEAIGAHGSITLAAQAVGLSYKGAWDGVQALNNLFERPLVAAQAGGKHGGAASITPAGEAMLEAYRMLDGALDGFVDQLREALAKNQTATPIVWSFGMRTSARNALRGTVETITAGAVNSEVVLNISDDMKIVAIVSKESVADLSLAPGDSVVALIGSSFVTVAPGGKPLRTSARNCLSGVISRHEQGEVNDEIVIDLGHGKTITATITRGSAEALGLNLGDPAQALIKASHIILAVI